MADNSGATAILKPELCKNAPLFAKTNVIFEISLSFSTIYQKIVLALQFSFKDILQSLEVDSRGNF